MAVVPDRLRREAGLVLDEAQWLIRQSRAAEGHTLLSGPATPRIAGGLLTIGQESWL
jgi:soluble lytic murein transglycosylase